jgi:hypothetical protein
MTGVFVEILIFIKCPGLDLELGSTCRPLECGVHGDIILYYYKAPGFVLIYNR